MKIMGREPAFWVGSLEAVILVAVAFGLPEEAGVVVTTLVVALGAVATAWTVRDTMLAALLGVARAVAGLVAYLGFALSDAEIATIMGALTFILSGFLRTQTEPLAHPTFHVEPTFDPRDLNHEFYGDEGNDEPAPYVDGHDEDEGAGADHDASLPGAERRDLPPAAG